MRITNARIYRNGTFEEGGIEFETTITGIGKNVCRSGNINARGAYIIPGLIDIHSHGAVGEDASDASENGLNKLAKYYAAKGVTSWCPATMTLGEDRLSAVCRNIKKYIRPLNGAKIAGINLEGPFINKNKKGSQNPDFICNPDIRLFYRLMEESDYMIKLVTIAPETDGALDFIRQVKNDVTVSMGHTESDYETAMRAFEAGAKHVTHLYNGMPSLHHRTPGIIAAAFDSGAAVELIPDGYHVHPAIVRMTDKLFDEKLILISDSIRCAGMPEGEYDLGGLSVMMKDNKAVLLNTDTIAGSSIHLMDGMKNSIRYGMSLNSAIDAVTIRPAKVLGMDKIIGSLDVGKAADFVILSHELEIINVFIDGKSII